MFYEYKVIPAPIRGLKAQGVKSVEDRFAHALQTAMNDLGAKGWEYHRSDTLPCEERDGLMGKKTVFQNMLVFRRSLNTQEPTAQVSSQHPVADSAPADLSPAQVADQRDSGSDAAASSGVDAG